MPIPPMRCEIAFSTSPDDPNPAYVDVTPWLDMQHGVAFTRGREDEFSTVQPGTAKFTLDNTDGRFTAGLTSSPYYPNVKLRKKVRFSARLAGSGNGFADPQFESGFADWASSSSAVSLLSWSTAQAKSGTHSMLITWQGSFAPGAYATIPTVINRQYTVSVYVNVPTGSPAVQLTAVSPAVGGALSSGTGWQQIFLTFTATTGVTTVQIMPSTAPVPGKLCYVDDAMWDEGTLQPFTTTPLVLGPVNVNAPISYRFTGYVDEWPVEWPGGSTYSEARVMAVDRLKRLGLVAKLRSVPEQEILTDSPYAYYTLGEPTGSVAIGDTSKVGRSTGSTVQLGSGGTLALGAGTGPATDGLTAAVFTPASAGNGKYLVARFGVGSSPGSTGQAVEICFNASSASQPLVALAGQSDVALLSLSTDASGRLLGTSRFAGNLLVSSGSVIDGATHHAALTQTIAGNTVTVTLYLDGASVASTTWNSPTGTLAPFSSMFIGGNSAAVFSGTLAHAACYDSVLPAARIADHSTAMKTGFAGESSDARIARYARWVGIPTAELSLEAGLSTSTTFVDTTGMAPSEAMQAIAATENGVLQVNGQGQLEFQARSHRYNRIVTVNLAGMVDPATKFVTNDALMRNDVTGSRPNGLTFRAVNAQSVLDFGSLTDTLTLLTTSDNEVVDAVNWRANQNAQQASRLPGMAIDILGRDAPTRLGVLLLDVGTRVTLSQLPATAPASSLDQFIEGWTETCTTDVWVLDFNTSPVTASGVWVLDSATYGQLDVSTRLAY